LCETHNAGVWVALIGRSGLEVIARAETAASGSALNGSMHHRGRVKIVIAV
jgi:hypothetical protein